jgi:hypothetical protein
MFSTERFETGSFLFRFCINNEVPRTSGVFRLAVIIESEVVPASGKTHKLLL